MGFYYNQPKGFYYNQEQGFYYDQPQQGFYYDQQVCTKIVFLILLRKEVLNRVLNLLFRMVTSPRDGRREMPIMSEKLPSSRLLLRCVNGEI